MKAELMLARLVLAALLVLPALLAIAAFPVTVATMPAVNMKVFDAHDGKPIADQAGALRFLKQDFSSQPFFLNTNYENPSMLLLQPGHAPLVIYNQMRIVPTLAEASNWAVSLAAPAACPARGEVIQWIADYCMLEAQTDDEIAISDCIADNLATKISDDCAAMMHFKRAMCGVPTEDGTPRTSVDACVADLEFMGRTVRHGGVGR